MVDLAFICWVQYLKNILTCVDAFFFRVFEKWDETEIIYVEETNSSERMMITYIVDDKTYRENGDAPIPGTPEKGQYYIIPCKQSIKM